VPAALPLEDLVTVIGEGGTELRPVALFVLGDARSGTSTLARVLSLCGGVLAGASSAIPGSGDRAPRASNIINEEILRRHRSSGFDPTLRLQEEGAFDADEEAACIGDMSAYLATLPIAPLVVFKDPRISLLSGLWFEAARRSGFDIAVVIAVRRPSEVIASVGTKSPVMPEVSSALWLKVNLLAETTTRSVSRVFVEHANLVEDWRREVERISVALGIELEARDERAIEQLLKPKFYQQRPDSLVSDMVAAERLSVVYEAMAAAARDHPLDQSALDQAFAAYRATERGFRPVFEGFQRLDKMNQHFRPSVMKMIDKARATAIRRRQT
jgi:hypothetical protein